MNRFIPWIDGKCLLRKTIIEMFPKDFNRYIEVFGGAVLTVYKILTST